MKTLISKVFLILGIILGLSAIACAQEGDKSELSNELKAINLKPNYEFQRAKILELNTEKIKTQKVTKKEIYKPRYAVKGLENKVSKPVRQEKIMIKK